MSRRLTGAVLAGLCLLMPLAAGCGGKAGEDKGKTPQSSAAASASEGFKTADELIREAEERASSSASEQAAQKFGEVAGVYRFSGQGLDEAYCPAVELLNDGKAIFHANLLTGMGDLSGTYTVSADSIHISVKEVAFSGFAGDNITDMVFDLVDGGSALELAYTSPETPVGITNAGDRFEKQPAA